MTPAAIASVSGESLSGLSDTPDKKATKSILKNKGFKVKPEEDFDEEGMDESKPDVKI